MPQARVPAPLADTRLAEHSYGANMSSGEGSIRESLVAQGVTFLTHESVAGVPLVERMQFLRSKGLTQDEVEEALTRAGDGVKVESSRTQPNSPVRPTAARCASMAVEPCVSHASRRAWGLWACTLGHQAFVMVEVDRAARRSGAGRRAWLRRVHIQRAAAAERPPTTDASTQRHGREWRRPGWRCAPAGGSPGPRRRTPVLPAWPSHARAPNADADAPAWGGAWPGEGPCPAARYGWHVCGCWRCRVWRCRCWGARWCGCGCGCVSSHRAGARQHCGGSVYSLCGVPRRGSTAVIFIITRVARGDVGEGARAPARGLQAHVDCRPDAELQCVRVPCELRCATGSFFATPWVIVLTTDVTSALDAVRAARMGT